MSRLIVCMLFLLSGLPAAFGAGSPDCDLKNLYATPPNAGVIDQPEDHWSAGTTISTNSTPTVEGEMFHCDNDVNVSNVQAMLQSSGATWTYAGRTFLVFKSSVPGIGYAIAIRDPLASSYDPVNTTDWIQIFPDSDLNKKTKVLGLDVEVFYVATGELKPGTYQLPQEQILQYRANIDDGLIFGHPQDFYTSVYVGANTLTIAARACTLLESQVDVDMDRVKASNFGGVGSAGPVVDFTVPLSCDKDVGVEMLVETASANDEAAGILNLAPGGAKGVGVQMLQADGSTPIHLGQPLEVIQNTVEGRNDLQLAARYIQVDDKVVPGRASAVAQFVLKYR